MSTKVYSKIEKEQTASAGQLALSVSIATDIELALLKNGMTQDQATAIKAGALAGLAGASFRLAGKEERVDVVAPLLMAGAIRAMNHPKAALGDGSSKLKTSEVLTSALFLSLSDKMGGLSDEERQALPGLVTHSAVSNLDEAGLTGDDLSNGIGAIVEHTVKNLDEAGFKPEELKGIVSKVTKSTVSGMKETGLESKALSKTLKAFVKRAVSSLDEAGVQTKDIQNFVGPVMTEAVGGLDELGFKGAGQMQSIVGDIMASTVTALSDAGVKEAKDLSGILNQAVKGAMDGIGQAGIANDQITVFVDDMMKGAVSSLDEIGIQDATAIQEIAGNISSDTIGYLDDYGIKDKEAIKKASESVATGTMAALGDLKDQGILDRQAVETASSAVSKKAVDAILLQAESHGFKNDIADVATGFTTGMVAGLSEAGWRTDDISAISDDIGAGFKEALADEAFVDQATLDSMTNTIQSSAVSWINDMEIPCVRDKGIWHKDGGWCEYPLSAPVEGAKAPSPEEEEGCFGDGGTIKYLPDGNWFCDIAAGDIGGIASFEDCQSNGYQWLKGPEGDYCETATPPSACWGNMDEGSCAGAPDQCAWVGDYCEAASFVRCPNYQDPLTCGANAGCKWDTHIAECVNDVCGTNPAAPECQTILAQPSGPMPVITGAPQGDSPMTLLNITVGGEGVVDYRFKIRAGADAPCGDPGGYSPYRGVNTPITDDIGDRPDGQIELCVVTRDVNLVALPEDQAIVMVWNKVPPGNATGTDLTFVGAPTGVSNLTGLDITVAGPDMVAYKYKIGPDPQDCLFGADYGPEKPVTEHIIEDLTAYDDGPIDLCIVGKDGAGLWQSYADATLVNWILDRAAPTQNTGLYWGEGPNTTSTMINAHWTPITEDGIEGQEVRLFSDPTCDTQIGAMVSLTPAIGTHAFTVGANGTYFFEILTYDDADNFSVACSPGITVTSVMATLTGAPTGNSSIVNLNIDVGGAAVSHYQYKVGTASGINCADPTNYLGEYLESTNITANISGEGDGLIRLCVIGRDNLGNWAPLANAVDVTWTKDSTVVQATTSGNPMSLNMATNLNVTVGGTGITAYKYKTGSSGSINCATAGGYSTEVGTGTVITDSISSQGANTLCVIGKDGSNNWQAEASATIVSWTQDSTAPSIINVDSPEATGAYTVGEVIIVDVHFDEAVNVLGNPLLTLETGPDSDAVYTSGTGTTTLSFSYTVLAGEVTGDLDYVSVSSLALNSGSMVDLAGNPANLALPSPGNPGSLGYNESLIIDTTPPTATISGEPRPPSAICR